MTAMMKNIDSVINSLTTHGVDLNSFRQKVADLHEEVTYLQYEEDYQGTLKEALNDLFIDLEVDYDKELLAAYQHCLYWNQDGKSWIVSLPTWKQVLEYYLRRYCFR